MNILSLDLGSTFGWCANVDATVFSGSTTLATEKELKADKVARMNRRSDIRLQRFFVWLHDAKMKFQPKAVVFEDVQFVKSRMQAHLWASYRTAAWLIFPRDKYIVDCVPTGDLKKFATGSSFANKDAMLRFLRDPRFDKRDLIDDNQVDAIWLWLWAEKTFARIQ